MTSIRTWFRTRWAALDWFFRLAFIPFGAFLAVASAIVGDWLGVAGVLVFMGIVSDWKYWREFGEVSKPVAEFGARMSGAIHAATADGQRALTLDIDGDQWTLRRRQDDATESSNR